ncbi:S1 family peptidase [Paenibacillus sp. ACRRX]|uniref:S1 family peptidase n=1 Tax=Paenibacillus sp. ACRRX TaxID=2918206 RepID=UPI001EF3EDE6|nr:S1 family peptidase [Paenibacillus sp. ACRRX]MCG7408231.1 S1 family peptidase [Paenibacillus sp. ACRRX]
MASFHEAYKAKTRLAPAYLKKKGIVGIGVGYVNPAKPSKGASVIVYTAKASAAAKLSIPSAVTTSSGGSSVSVPIRVIVSGHIKANKATISQLRDRIRPVPAGYSVGYPSIPGSGGVSGTAGLIVINNPQRNQLLICSNNHVLNRNNTAGFSETVQPGAADGGNTVTDRIGRLERFIRLQPNATNFLDAATSIPLSNSLLNPRYAGVGVIPGHLLTYRVGERFKKSGRTTGFVRGTVESVNSDFNVDYGTYGGLGTILFRNQTVVLGSSAVSLPGDSGSVWLRDSDSFAAAVNYASTSNGLRSISYPFNWFAQAFNVLVARPAGSTGRVKGKRQTSPAYAQPLTARQLSSIKIVRARRARRK